MRLSIHGYLNSLSLTTRRGRRQAALSRGDFVMSFFLFFNKHDNAIHKLASHMNIFQQYFSLLHL